MRTTATSAATAMEDPPKTVPTCGESSASKRAGRVLDARAEGDGEAHERGIALRQAVAGKHDHAVHADGREHADRGAADYRLRNGREHCRALGSRPAMSKMAAASVKTTRLTILFSAIMPHSGQRLPWGRRPKSPTAYRPAVGDQTARNLAIGRRGIERSGRDSGKLAHDLHGVDNGDNAHDGARAGSNTRRWAPRAGGANQLAVAIAEKSTMPNAAAKTKPAQIPARMLPSLSAPLP